MNNSLRGKFLKNSEAGSSYSLNLGNKHLQDWLFLLPEAAEGIKEDLLFFEIEMVLLNLSSYFFPGQDEKNPGVVYQDRVRLK